MISPEQNLATSCRRTYHAISVVPPSPVSNKTWILQGVLVALVCLFGISFLASSDRVSLAVTPLTSRLPAPFSQPAIRIPNRQRTIPQAISEEVPNGVIRLGLGKPPRFTLETSTETANHNQGSHTGGKEASPLPQSSSDPPSALERAAAGGIGLGAAVVGTVSQATVDVLYDERVIMDAKEDDVVERYPGSTQIANESAGSPLVVGLQRALAWIPIAGLAVGATGLYLTRGSQGSKKKDSAIYPAQAPIPFAGDPIVIEEEGQAYIDALRGKDINSDDFASVSTIQVVVDDDEKYLPDYYDIQALEDYFSARPVQVTKRVIQVFSAFTEFATTVAALNLKGLSEDEFEQRRAQVFRDTLSKLGPFFIKFGQALSIRPDVVSTIEMKELQRLCDKVPPFDNDIAMAMLEEELGGPLDAVFSTISSAPVAAASLGQVYKATLKSTGEEVAVKVQRPYVLGTVALDLWLTRKGGILVQNLPFLNINTDLRALVDEFAARFYNELDYNQECQNGIKIAEDLKDLKDVVVPKCYPELTTKKMHVAEWIDGEKLSASKADNVAELVSLGTVAYLTQLLGSGFFHADPHPGNMMRTSDGKLCILDFGLMTSITENEKFGMIESIAHLVHRDYEKIGEDFKGLGFIPEEVDVKPILPVLGRVFDQALKGGGAKSINFNELAADLAEITYEYPFQIPPFFALVIRAIGVLEGLALVGDPDFAIISAAYPYISNRLLTDQNPRLREALRYLIYGKDNEFNVRRLIDLLDNVDMFVVVSEGGGSTSKGTGLRQALVFLFSPDGKYLRKLLLSEMSKSVDAMSRDALWVLASRLGPGATMPASFRAAVPTLSKEDQVAVENLEMIVEFTVGNAMLAANLQGAQSFPQAARLAEELADVLPVIGPGLQEFGLELVAVLSQKIAARLLKFSAAAEAPATPAKVSA